MYTHAHTSFLLFTFGSKIECYNICFIIFDPPEALWHLVHLFFLLRDDSLIVWSRWRKYLAECLHCDNDTSGRESGNVFEHAQKDRSWLHFFLLHSPMYKLKKYNSTVELITMYKFQRGHRPLVIDFGSAPKSVLNTCKYGQPSYCPGNPDVLSHSFPQKKVNSSKIYFGGP